MCMITYLPGEIEVPEAGILNGATWNDDGHGWALAVEPGVMLSGRYMDIDTALTTFIATREAFPKAPAVFHSRLATHGVTGLSNVHPFTVGKYAVVAHNGILPTKFQPKKGDARSDTHIMASAWLAGRSQTSGVWTRRERRRIGSIIGTGNKLCILSVSPLLPEPRGYLVNGDQGTWDEATGAWFSSRDFRWEWEPSKSYSGWLWGENEGISRSTWRNWGVCPQCHTNEDVSEASGICAKCAWCLDCDLDLDACMCHYPRVAALKASTLHDDDGEAAMRS